MRGGGELEASRPPFELRLRLYHYSTGGHDGELIIRPGY